MGVFTELLSPLMKNKNLVVTLGAALATIASLIATPASATDVGVSVQISQPGVYGRVDIGRFPQPQVVVQQPVIIARPVAVQRPQPVYMWVPPGHRKQWSRHCAEYRACGVPVYFVRDDWYDQRVRPHERDHERGPGMDRDRRDERGDRDDRGDHGPGRGHGRGEGRGHDRKD